MSEYTRLQLVCLWSSLVAAVSALYLADSVMKALIVGAFFIVSQLLGFGTKLLQRISFVFALLALVVYVGLLPPPDTWGDKIALARDAFAGLR